MKRLWVTGYRSYELGVFSDKDPKLTIIKYALSNYLKSLLEEGKIDWVISGANLGTEQWGLETAISLQNDYSVHTALMTPYLEFSKEVFHALEILFTFISTHIHHHPTILKENEKLTRMVKELYDILYDI